MVEVKQQLKVAPQLVLTPQMQQAIKLLQLSRLELDQVLREEISQNPVLEEAEEPADEEWREQLERWQRGEEGLPRMDVWEEEEPVDLEGRFSRRPTLQDHLVEQVMLLATTPRRRALALTIVGNLDEDGYLRTPLEEIAQATGASLTEVGEALRLVQELDPPGIAARNLRECLLLQLHARGNPDPLAERLVRDHLEELDRPEELAGRLGIPLEEVNRALELIRSLDPKPGRALASAQVPYLYPDVYVFKEGGRWVIQVNEDGLPHLRINPRYRQLLAEGDEETRRYVEEKLRRATWLIKNLYRRRRTLERVMESILRLQRDFFEKGPRHLKPLVLRQVAEDMGVHESTVSRVTANKYVHTPHGTFPLKYFFSGGKPTGQGDQVLKDRIRKIIQAEDPNRPYSDDQIASLLRRQGFKVARRTVAKYRGLLGIPPSTQRGGERR